MGKGFTKEHLMTIGADFSKKAVTLGKYNIEFQIWDIAGQDQFKMVRTRFLKNPSGVFIVYDVTRKESFEKISKWLKELWEINNRKDIPVLVIGNKIDLGNRDISQNEVIAGMTKIKDKHLKNVYFGHMETSALTGANIEKSFEQLASEIFKNMAKK